MPPTSEIPSTATTTTTSQPPPPIEVPSISTTENGNITISLAHNAYVKIQWVDDAGSPVGLPVPLATHEDLNYLRSEINSQLTAKAATLTSTFNAQLQAQQDALSSQMQTQGQALSDSISAIQLALQANTTSLAQSLLALSNTMVATASELRHSIQTVNVNLGNTIASNQQTVLGQTQALSSSITQLTSSVQTTDSALQTQINFKVDMRNLSSINPQIQQVVANMASGVPAGNTLAVQLGSKLSNSPTCQCFNPGPFSALSNIVNELVNVTSATLSCSTEGLGYNPVTHDCVRTVPITDCSSRISTLPAHASSSCGLVPGSTREGATCVATCDLGYNGGISAMYTCNSSGLWMGSLQCPGRI